MNVRIKRLHENAVIPQYANDGDAGLDLVAVEDVIIEPGETALVRTGIAFEIPQGYEMQIRPRSGVTLKTKLRVQIGTIDAGYRGDVGVIIDNTAPNGMGVDYYSTYRCDFEWGAYKVSKGTRIAQAVLKRVEKATFAAVAELSETVRGAGGFGSTGTK